VVFVLPGAALWFIIVFYIGIFLGLLVMDVKKKEKNGEDSRDSVLYTPPKIVSYHCDDLLEKLGPVCACITSPTCTPSDTIGM